MVFYPIVEIGSVASENNILLLKAIRLITNHVIANSHKCFCTLNGCTDKNIQRSNEPFE